MAEAVVRLKVDSAEYNSKIRNASSELAEMMDKAKKAGATFEIADKSAIDMAHALGEIGTTSNNTKRNVADITAVLTQMKARYSEMTKEEKKSEFGQALSTSISKLKIQLADAKAGMISAESEMEKMGGSGNSLSDIINTITRKLGIGEVAFAKLAKAVAAATAALNVVKDSFFANEENLDEWNRTVESAKGVYEGFLTSLNTGDISGYLSRIDQIVSAARTAYNELDRLGTQKAMDNKSLKTQQTENERMRAMLRTGRYIAPLDGRASASGLQNGEKLTEEQLANIAKNLEGGLKKVNKIFEDEIKQTGKSIESLYKQEATNLGMSAEAFKKGTANMQAFDKVIAGYNKYKEFEQQNTSTIQSAIGPVERRSGKANPFQQYAAWGTFLDDGERFTKLNELVNQKTALEMQQYNAQAQAFRSMNKAEGVSSKGTSAVTSKAAEQEKTRIQEIGSEIQKLTDEALTATKERQDGIRQEIATLNLEKQKLQDIVDFVNGKVKPLAKDETATVTVQLNDEQIKSFEKLKDDKHLNSTIDVKQSGDVLKLEDQKATATIDVNFEDNEAYQEFQKWTALNGIVVSEPVIKIKPAETNQGISGPSTAAFSAWAKGLQDEMAKVDITTPLYQNLQAQLADTTALQNIIGYAFKNGISLDNINLDTEGLWDKILNDEDIENADWQSIVDAINEQLAALGIDPIKLNFETGEIGKGESDDKSKNKKLENATGLQMTEQIASGLRGITQGLEALGVKIPDGITKGIEVMQGVLTITSSIATIVGVIQTLEAAQTLTNAIPFFSTGGVLHASTGIVPGTSYTGDRVPAMVNSNEMILNMDEQRNLFDAIRSGNLGAGNQTAVGLGVRVTGDTLYTCLDNHMKRTGKRLPA